MVHRDVHPGLSLTSLGSARKWWLPVYEIEAENSMAFHPRYFDTPVRNSSADYDYEEWNRTGRKQAAEIVKAETRKQPRPEEQLDVSSEIRIVTPLVVCLASPRPSYTRLSRTTRTGPGSALISEP